MSKQASRRARRATSTLCALSVAAATWASPSTARAEEVAPTGKGIVGGALLGGELVVLTESLFGVRSPWAYVGGAAAGAAAGGVGGYFVEQSVSDGRIPVYLLAGGLALVIPSVVVTLNATRYQPSEGASEDRAPVNAPAADPGQAGGSAVEGVPQGGGAAPAAPAPAPAAPAPASEPAPGGAPSGAGGGSTTPATSLIDVRGGALRIGVPIPEVRPVLSMAERARLGATTQASELRMPMLHVTF